MQAETTTLRELTVRYSVRKDSEDRSVVVGRALSRPIGDSASSIAWQICTREWETVEEDEHMALC